MSEPSELKKRDETLENILRTSIENLEEYNKEAYEQLIQHARDGFFEQHQSVGKIGRLADMLLNALEEGGEIDED